ncbi:uncharacterized protein LOC108100140 [Drosophila ficusphila]|uniref:uncharacterized protein LOC108100140 n=1 Tax=Drosophila ficusphila TaxID=30025 RepID=UPI0007E85F8A|nr:uncharacterized protein LOC108100140 [Drosophila ficusphila]
MAQSRRKHYGVSLCLVISLFVGSLNAECCKEGETKVDEEDCTKYQVCCHGEFVSKSCGSGDYWNSEIELCEKDSGQCQAPSCKCGEIEPNPDDCAGYLECVNGTWVNQICSDGNYFNSTQNKCVVDTCGVCVNCTEGNEKEDPNDCASFLICLNGKYVSKSCPSGEYWDSEIGKCELDEGQCNPTPPCKEGETEVDPTDCAGYLICSNGILYPQSCPERAYFNETYKTCIPDEKGVCLNCTEGSLEPEPSDCTKFKVCTGGKYVTKSCDDGDYWNNKTKVCEKDNGQCNGNGSNCTEGVIEEDPNNCAGYLICSNGSLVEKQCADGAYFNNSTQTCIPDEKGVCLNCTEGTLEPEPSDCTKYKVCTGGKYVTKSCDDGDYWNNQTKLCEEDKGQCNGNSSSCTEGELERDTSDCAGYLICSNGSLVAKKCPDGAYFNTTLKTCVQDTDGVCLNCTEGAKKAEPSDCAKYQICAGGKYQVMSCASGEYWNNKSTICEKDNGECHGNATCTEGAVRENPADCTGYLECIHGDYVARQCSAKEFFNATSKECEVDTDGVCIPKTCDPDCCDVPNNSIWPVENNCSAFFYCVDGAKIEQRCQYNLQFNNKTDQCDYPENVGCDDGSAPPSGPTAGPSGTYCESQGECVGKRDGTMLPDPSGKCSSSYVVCQCECEVNFSCSSGLLFNKAVNSCDWPDNVDCVDQIPRKTVDLSTQLSLSESNSPECLTSSEMDSSYCLTLSNGFYQYPYDCSAYISCNDSCADLEYCPDGKLFNSPLRICDTPEAVDCNPMPYPTPPSTELPPENPCEGVKNNTLIPSADKCNEFIVCVNQQSEVYRCPGELLFNPDLKVCDDKDNVLCYGDRTTEDPLTTTGNVEESFTKCEGQKAGTTYPYIENCQEYYYCWGNNSYIILPCPVENWFNPMSGNCGPEISPKACRDLVATTASLSTTPISTTDAPKTTEVTEVNPCENQELGASFPLKTNCQMYLLCLGSGQSTTAKCPSNAWFDPKTGDCGPNVSPTACQESETITTTVATTHSSNPCADQELGVSFPMVTNCKQYIVCMGNGESSVANCIYNAYFDPQTGNCGPEVSPTACKETESTTSPATTSPTTIASTWLTTLPTIYPEETTEIPSDTSGICTGQIDGYYATYPEDCSKYILCASPVPIAFYCPEGLFFNEELQNCVEWESSECPKDDTTTAYPDLTTLSPEDSICFNNSGNNLPYQENCQWFIKCVDDSSYMMGICSSGEFFDPLSGECGFDVSPEACRESFTTVVTETTQESTTVTTESTPKTEVDPCEGAAEGKLVPYPDDCTKFIQCVWPTPKVYDCREGQEFSASLERCMAPWYANCSIPATTTTAFPITTTTLPSQDGFCEGKGEGSLVPYPGNCSKYIVCRDPIPVGYACPENEEFSPTVLTCMDAELANCKPSGLRLLSTNLLTRKYSNGQTVSLWQSFKRIANWFSF